MRILAVVTARAGSKRVPGKNIRSLGGSPLILWSIEAAKGIPDICDILVSTDDTAIAEVAREAGALVPWLRPEELATDTASSAAVCQHALDWYESVNAKVDGLMLLQPTSPFRSRATVMHGVELFFSNQRRPVVGASTAESHPMWTFKVEGQTMRPYMDGGGLRQRSQDLPPAYVVNGSFYLISPDDLRELRSFFSGEMVPLIIGDRDECIDIDTERDWRIAELVLGIRSRDSQWRVGR